MQPILIRIGRCLGVVGLEEALSELQYSFVVLNTVLTNSAKYSIVSYYLIQKQNIITYFENLLLKNELFYATQNLHQI